jgi:hypothetical protein
MRFSYEAAFGKSSANGYERRAWKNRMVIAERIENLPSPNS